MRIVCFVWMTMLAAAQQTIRPAQLSTIEGQVISDLNEMPLRRAHVTLRPMDGGVDAIGADGDEHGKFIIRDIPPGRYFLVADRDGYLRSYTFLRGGVRMPQIFQIRANTRMSNLTFRLRPWAVISGHVRFDDAEPAIGIRVDAYREYRYKGRHGYSVAASAVTDDHGEYRMHGLQPGSYLIAAVYERVAPQGYTEQARVDDSGHELPPMSYTTTFYPNTVKLNEAVSVHLDYGKEVPAIDLYLMLVRKVKIRGRVRSGVSGVLVANATLTLQRMDSRNAAAMGAATHAKFDTQKNFEISDVTPGTYLLTAEGTDEGTTLAGRTILTVSESDVNEMELLIGRPRDWEGKIRVEGGEGLDSKKPLVVTLEPRSDKGSVVSAAVRDLGFTATVLSDETYDLYVQNIPEDFYISEVRVNGNDVLPRGLDSRIAGSGTPLEVVLDSRGGRVAGQVVDSNNNAWSGASLMLIPDPAQGRLQSYRNGSADEYGHFQIRGVPPGKYVLVAWLDDPPCDLYDPEGVDVCRIAGM